MSFGKRLLELRKIKKMSQTELAEKLGIHKNVLGKYEREEVKPSIDIAIKVADFMDVSLDFLVGKVDIELDKSIVEKVMTIQKFPKKDQDYIIYALDALIRDAKSRFAYTS